MANLSISLAGITSPNPFWLASAPPTNTGYQVQRQSRPVGRGRLENAGRSDH